MINLYVAQRNLAQSIDNDTDRLSYSICILRSLLQLAAITSLEIIEKRTPFPENNEQIPVLAHKFSRPLDSLPIEILDESTPIIRSLINNSFNHGWYKGEKTLSPGLAQTLQEWLAFRNDKIGHGALSTKDSNEWAPKTLNIIDHCIECFSDFLPKIGSDGKQKSYIASEEIQISIPMTYENQPIVIKRIHKRKGIWQMEFQTLSRENSLSRATDLPNTSFFETLSSNSKDKFSLREVPFKRQMASIYNNIPSRQTDIFVGRNKEIDRLTEWINDEDGVKYCLIYGEGGIGKTTLALEFLNRILDGEILFTNQPPTIICYYSAKGTQWTENGMQVIRGLPQAMEQCVREILFCFDKVLPADAFKLSGERLVDMVAYELQNKHGVPKGDVIFVIDNTETLSESNTETEDFVRFVTQIGKRIGKVLMTSRRRELLEFKPISTPPLSENDSKTLLRQLAEKYNATAIKQAGDANLKKISEKLGHKPLLIDVLVKYISRTNSGIDSAMNSILKKNSEELLDFLYEDAWNRINESQKKVFLALTTATVPIDDKYLNDVCSLVGIHNEEFRRALDETRFAKISSYTDHDDIQIIDIADTFFRARLSKLPLQEQEEIKSIKNKADNLANNRQTIAQRYKGDRVVDAFTSDFAKAAKNAATRRDYKEAENYYILALKEDPMNSSLHDRFAWFLLHSIIDPDRAITFALKAVNLDPSNSDAHLTLALCQYRLNDIEKGDISIDRAQKLGKLESLCLLRKGVARYYAASASNSNKVTKIKILSEGKDLLKKSLLASMREDHHPYKFRNTREAKKYEDMISNKIGLLKRGG